MLHSGVTELIWHFAGYLHLTDELARARVQYEDMKTAQAALEYEPGDPVEDGDIEDLDELGSGRADVHWPVFDQAAHLSSANELRNVAGDFQPVDFALGPISRFHRVPTADFQIDMTGAGRDTSLRRQEGGDETNVDVDQINFLSDNDRFGVRFGLTTEEVAGTDIAAEISSLRGLAASAGTEELFPSMSGSIPDVASSVVEMQTDSAASGEEPAHLEFGVYVDGILQTGGPEADPEAEEPVDARRDGAPPPLPGQPDDWQPGDPGSQAAELGSNTAYNGAVIVDFDEACGTFVVLGNSYRTNAVVQTNVYSDSDHVRIGGNGPEAFVALNQNEATNTAELSQEALLDGVVDYRGLTGFHWNIDISYGNYYDVKTLYQENTLYSNDIVCQTTTGAYYRVMVDANGQSNTVQVEDYGNSYDLIVVLGNYHAGNFIHQTNILLDNDWMTMTEPGEGGGQTVYGGQNQLTNEAAISYYGLDGYAGVSSDFEAFIRSLETRDDIPPEEWWSYSGSGSTEMNVLFVTGDYYDINYIRQLNLVADADAAMQIAGNGTDQFVSTGGNTATNFATIIDVGAYGDQYVGGEAYEDWTLVQTNIISAEDDEVVYGDSSELASEVVAFAYAGEEEEGQVDGGAMPLSSGGDELGHVMA